MKLNSGVMQTGFVHTVIDIIVGAMTGHDRSMTLSWNVKIGHDSTITGHDKSMKCHDWLCQAMKVITLHSKAMAELWQVMKSHNIAMPGHDGAMKPPVTTLQWRAGKVGHSRAQQGMAGTAATTAYSVRPHARTFPARHQPSLAPQLYTLLPMQKYIFICWKPPEWDQQRNVRGWNMSSYMEPAAVTHGERGTLQAVFHPI